jgi:hypothetical protein
MVAFGFNLVSLQATQKFNLVQLPLAGKLSEPMGMMFRPNVPNQLWIVNHGNDSIAIVKDPASSHPQLEARTDAYAEHFVAKPTGISFGQGETFAISNNSINEVRGMKFTKNPERNQYFAKNHFMGPTLFSAATYALAGQSKRYLEDWPQPGNGHDAALYSETGGCPPEFWSPDVRRCYWPREGSHVDMLHESPLTMGIIHDRHNAYYVLDGCGSRDDRQQCVGDGHLVRYDFNRDHQEGNGFHGDGVVWRYPEISFKRVNNVPSGMVIHDGFLYFANSGKGTIEQVSLDRGNIQKIVRSWSDRTDYDRVGSGIINWVDVTNGPGDGDDPNVILAWTKAKGDPVKLAALGKSWIPPMETLAEYAYIYRVPQQTIIEQKWLSRPSGLATDSRALYVADYESGWIAAFDWKTFKPLWRYRSNLTSISGLTIDPTKPGNLYITDKNTNSLYRLQIS